MGRSSWGVSPSSHSPKWWEQDSNPGLPTTNPVLVPTRLWLGLLDLSRSLSTLLPSGLGVTQRPSMAARCPGDGERPAKSQGPSVHQAGTRGGQSPCLRRAQCPQRGLPGPLRKLNAGPQGGGCAGRGFPRAGLEEYSQRRLRRQPRAQNLAEEPESVGRVG